MNPSATFVTTLLSFSYMKQLVLVCLIFLELGCNKKSSSGSLQDLPLQGRWEMTDLYVGNGGDTETHQNIKFVYYTYTDTDSLYQLYTDIFLSTKLTNLTDSTYLTDDSQLPFTYRITGNKMELKHPCDEGCRWLFTKVE
jgi:hypothetical protein